MPSNLTPLRYTLDCRAVTWHVLHVEEGKSLARPPSMTLDVTTERPLGELGELERSIASVLVEGPNGSRVVRGWVRYVEHIGAVDARSRLRLHLVPVVMAEDAPVRGVEAPVAPPAMLAVSLPSEDEGSVEPCMVPTPRGMEPAPLAEQDVTAEHTPEQLRAMRGEDADDEAPRRAAARLRTKERQEITDVAPRPSDQVPKPEGAPVRTGGTQLMTREDLERLKAPAQAVRPKGAVTETERLRPVVAAAEDERPDPHREAPERKRRKKRKADDETAQLTWAQLEALHRDRGKPKP